MDQTTAAVTVEPEVQRPAISTQAQPPTLTDRLPRAVWIIAAVFVAIELAVSGRYGFQQDELYFLVAGHHLAFGYVDQPPLTPLLMRIITVFGVNPTVVRIIPAVAGGAIIVAAARQAALFGAGRTARTLAALVAACAPVVVGGSHLFTTEPLGTLTWTAVVLCASTAVLRDRPRWWIGAGIAAGIGLQNNNLIALLLIGLGLGLWLGGRTGTLRTRWPWLAAAIAAAIWSPNVIWQATHGWPQLAMASSLRHENDDLGSYIGGLPAQLVYVGLFVAPVTIAGIVRLWRRPELRFLAVTVTVVVVYVVAWIPGRPYYADGLLPAVVAAGCVATENWIGRGQRPRLRHGTAVVAPLLGLALVAVYLLPIAPVASLHTLSGGQTDTTITDTVGWPQLAQTVAAQDAALSRAGEAPTAIFTGEYAEAGALDVFGAGDHLPPVLSGQNAFWMWGPGTASDRTVLVVDALEDLRPYFAQCRLVATFRTPDDVSSDFTPLPIAVCSGPTADWPALWPHLRHYD